MANEVFPIRPRRLQRLLDCIVLVFALAGWTGCKFNTQLDPGTVQGIVRGILEQQAQDWNDGNVEKFMRGYYQSDSTRFASGGDVSIGWKAVLERYKQKYPNRAAMGKLTFSDIDVTVLSPDAALAFGRWQLQRENDNPSGLFTLLFRNTTDGWRIVHDHTSAATKP
jgi:ketosteroid isomerase-like protein